jgi:serine/threonine protein kinase
MHQLTAYLLSSNSETTSVTSLSKSRWSQRLHVGSKRGSLDQTQSRAPSPHFFGHVAHRSKFDDCDLVKKYGKLGATVGEGAGGSIRLVTRPSDGVVCAVKKFRARSPHEDEREYARKVKIEFNIGSCLRHRNIIETLDLFEVHGQWYEVMEYAPYCLFEIALSRKMSREEINCSFLQVLAGVRHLHRLGYAHRDLKLENIVVTESGVMKMIDFGSATMSRHPHTGPITLANGVVGCLPYMAPEILLDSPYDAQKADVWSLAIIYCSMILGRFPWKVAALYDKAFILFATTKGQHRHAERGMERSSSEPASLKPLNPAAPVTCDLKATNSDTVSMINFSPDGAANTQRTRSVLEPCRPLSQLPSESRALIRDMLLLNAKSRPSLEAISQYSWIEQSQACSQDTGNSVHYGPQHEHVLRS